MSATCAVAPSQSGGQEIGSTRGQVNPNGHAESLICAAHPASVHNLRPALSVQISEYSAVRPGLVVRPPVAPASDSSQVVVMLEEVGGRVRHVEHCQTTDLNHAMHFIPPNTPFTMDCGDVGYARWITIWIAPQALPRLFAPRPVPTLPHEARRSFFDARILGLALLLETENKAERRSSSSYIDGLCIGLVSALASEALTGPRYSTGGLTPRQLRVVTEYATRRLGEALGTEELAGLVQLSPSHFSRAFKATTGSPPHRWLRALRVERAKALLLRGDALAQIAMATGFNDQSHFTNVFGQVEGVSPGAWRRQRTG